MRTDSASRVIAGFAPVWLRANCPCPACLDPVSGQRLAAIADLPDGLGITSASVWDTSIDLVFAPDGHQATFSVAWLESHRGAARASDTRTEDAKRLWRAAEFAGGPPRVSWREYTSRPATRLGCLDSLLCDGFFLLRDVPAEPGAVLDLVASFGFVRETNYGRLFDVRAEVTPANLAYTGLAIAPHTDNPYRDPVPTMQLLHCLVSAVEGGESGLVDGFGAAATLRRDDPAGFAMLAATPVTFAYADATTQLTATSPVISLDPLGRIREIRVNDRSLRPLRAGAGQTERFYAAYRSFARLIGRPELRLSFRLEPGDCVVFDNTRILHSRAAFADTGRRHLQGCYSDLDGAASTAAALRRSLASRPGELEGAGR